MQRNVIIEECNGSMKVAYSAIFKELQCCLMTYFQKKAMVEQRKSQHFTCVKQPW